MKALQYWLMKLRSKFSSNPHEYVSDYFRKMGMKIGENCNICDNISTTEAYLITIGNNVTLAGGVIFIAHDNSISKLLPNTTDLLGTIAIGDNCFIGNRAMLLYGVQLADNIIVAAGSVVTKSFLKSGIIIGGNPAKVIGICSDFAEKNKDKAFNLDGIPRKELVERVKNSNKLIIRKILGGGGEYE